MNIQELKELIANESNDTKIVLVISDDREEKNRKFEAEFAVLHESQLHICSNKELE